MNFRFINILHFSYLILLISARSTYAQIEISRPRIEVVNDKMIINYDILGSVLPDTIDISLEVADSSGNKVIPKTVDGDIGKNISSGLNKKIIWDLRIDSFYVDMNIYVRVIADIIKAPEIVLKEEPDEELITSEIKKQDNEEEKKNLSDGKETKIKEIKEKPGEDYTLLEESADISPSVSVGKIVFLSTVFPGWGLTKLSNKKPFWLIGVAGTCCIAASVYFNQQASSNYDNYASTNELDKIDTYYNKAEQQKLYSNIFVISAAAIWVADIGAAGIKAIRVKKSNLRNKQNDVSIGYYFDPVTGSPVLSLTYKF